MHFKRHLSLPKQDRRQLLEWGSDIFNLEGLQLIWRPKQITLVLYDQEQALSTCGLLRQTVQVGKQRLEVGGIGGVVTPPSQRGQGYASRILAEAMRIFREEWHLDAGMLFCRDALQPYYSAQGWQALNEAVRILQPEGPIDCPVRVMVAPISKAWPAGPVQIDSLPW